MRKQGKHVTALKPVISGFDPADVEASDTGILLKAQGLELSPVHVDMISPWRFREPISPDMAAENEKRNVALADLAGFCRKHEKGDVLLVEGVGGCMVPVGQSYTVLDWMAALRYPVILVAGSYLGTLSHTLTAYQAIAERGLTIHAVVINESEDSPVPVERTMLTLQRFLPKALPVHMIARTQGNISGILND